MPTDPSPAATGDPAESVGAPPTRMEAAILAVIVLAGFWLRAAHSERISVEHFDEGVYASDWYCQPPGLPDGKFPRQYLYAPPLLPNVCFWTLFFSGSDPHAVVWINILAGTLTIPLFWQLGRTWFGPSSGLLAAALCAFSDLHIALSRMVLTDVLLCLFLTAGVWAGVRALQTGRPLWIVLGGLLAGLAWWTKYNGWLTLAITGGGLAGWIAFDRRRDVPVRALLFRWFATAVIAVVVWSPVPWGLQSVGGYSVVAANHSRYFVGLAGWGTGLTSQMSKAGYVDSGLGILLSAAAVFVVLFSFSTVPSWKQRLFSATVAASLTVFLLSSLRTSLGAELFVAVLTLLVMPRLPYAVFQRIVATWFLRSPLHYWTALAWVAGLLLAVPLYTAYPRLSLPLACAGWLGMSLYLSPPRSESNPERKGPSVLMFVTFVVAFVGLAAMAFVRRGPDCLLPEVAWQDRRGLELLAAPIVDAAQDSFAADPTAGRQQMKAALYVFAEPALFYHLAALPKRPDFRFFTQPLGDHSLLSGKPPHPELATFLLAGPHVDANPDDARRFADAVAAGRLALVTSFPYTPSDLVLLDQTGPHGLAAAREQSVRLYRLQ